MSVELTFAGQIGKRMFNNMRYSASHQLWEFLIMLGLPSARIPEEVEKQDVPIGKTLNEIHEHLLVCCFWRLPDRYIEDCIPQCRSLNF